MSIDPQIGVTRPGPSRLDIAIRGVMALAAVVMAVALVMIHLQLAELTRAVGYLEGSGAPPASNEAVVSELETMNGTLEKMERKQADQRDRLSRMIAP